MKNTVTDTGTDPLPEDARLLAALRRGDDGAFETLVRTHGGRLLAVARRFLENDEDARDAVQDAFLSAYRSLDRFKGDALVSTWLHRIAVNAALMKLRSRRRKPEVSIDELLPEYHEDGRRAVPCAPWRDTPESELERRETRERVLSEIDRLPDPYRIVLLLRDIQELTTEDTARTLGESTNVVKVRLHRARQALRTLLDPHYRRTIA